ncbi:glycosyltransferase [Sphingomonas sp. AAP5]|nr:glycosyltransferase [Sphingomonas sp. AAP5]
MRIVVDLQGAQGSNRHRGIGRYCLSLAKSMVQNAGDHEVYIALNAGFDDTIEPIRAAFDGIVADENFLVWQALTPAQAADPQNDARRRASELLREATLASVSPDCVLITSIFEGLDDNVVTSIAQLSSTVPTAVVLFDLIPLLNRTLYLSNPIVEKWYENKIGHLRNADLLLTISESARREALEHLSVDPLDAVNISAAAESHFSPAAVNATDRAGLLKRYGIKRPFVMYTGGIDHRKNVEGIIEAFAALPAEVRDSHQLAIVCSIQPFDRERLSKLATGLGLQTGAVILTGFISDEDLLLCYRACKLFVFPSWHEGFGLPALEAMKCGRAVITSNGSSLPEVVGLEDAMFDPFDVQAMSDKIERVLIDDTFRERLERHGLERAKAFSWDKTSRRAWAALEEMHRDRRDLSADRNAMSGRRPRLAFVSPVPPAASGIADYSAELIPALLRHYRVEVITPQEGSADPKILGNCEIRDLAWFRRHANEFDRIVYQFGNSQFHSHMFDLIRSYPGVVVLHDFFLSGVAEFRDGIGETSNGMVQTLVDSYGWPAALKYFSEGPPEAGWTYPCNLRVIQDALGIIVHSDYPRQLARSWYGKDAGQNWNVIPLLREPLASVGKAVARKTLGIDERDFIVCSFGVLGPMKLNDRLLAAWLASPLAQNPSCHLIFVGQNDAGEYGANLQRAVRSAKTAGRIEITGWTDLAAFRGWLAAADVGVQLRALSRGETSAAVLDCMNGGLPTIVNANGSMAELPGDCVWMLDDDFTDADLVTALSTLFEEDERRRTLGANAKARIATLHQPRRCAAAYADAIEHSYTQANLGEYGLGQAVVDDAEILSKQDWATLASAIARNLPPAPRPKRIYVDVSELVQRDSKSGIQRVVRSILKQWLVEQPEGWIVEPVFADHDILGYRHARSFTAGFLGVTDNWANDPIEPGPGDVFVGLDLQSIIVSQQRKLLEDWHRSGVKIYFVVYDLLPVVLSDHFVAGAQVGHSLWLHVISQFTGVVCISRAVADEFLDWLDHFGPKRARPIDVHWFHLGADTENSAPSFGLPDNASEVLAALRAAPSFVTVGTIEPRKGHRQVVAAFEKLWARGVAVNLVLVGKLGWLMEDFAGELRANPQYGVRLFWLEAITDEYLEKVYASCACLIAASEGEGFGLPLIEASRHGLPVLARDIPVFREIGGNAATYFANSLDPAAISNAVEMLLSHKQNAVRFEQIPWLTWAQSAKDLLACVLGESPPYRQWKTDGILRFWGNDERLLSLVGKRRRREIESAGKAGYLVYGPYMPLQAGSYRVTATGSFEDSTGGEYLDISSNRGKTHHVNAPLDWDQARWRYSGILDLGQGIDDIEIRIWVDEKSLISLESIEIKPVIELENV